MKRPGLYQRHGGHTKMRGGPRVREDSGRRQFLRTVLSSAAVGVAAQTIQAELLRTSSTVIRDAVKASKLKVEAGVYDLATGKVTWS